MQIRELSGADAAEYSQLRAEGLESEPFAFGQAVEEHRRLSLEEIAGRLGSIAENKFTLGAFEADDLIGTATFIREAGRKENHKGRIYGVYVTRAHRGTGVGKALISAVVARARLFPSLEQIQLAVATRQQAACRLYRKLGFEAWGTEPSALKIGSEYVDEMHMILRLR